jgi:hypothetical protein
LYNVLTGEDAMPIEARTQTEILNPKEAEELLGQRHQYVK